MTTPVENTNVENRVAVVVIGRNEGPRLRACLTSVIGRVRYVVYVDSGSNDGSAALARDMGADVVELDASSPFSAARGRNAGFSKLAELAADVPFVQFVDGDCELAPTWPGAGAEYLLANPGVAAVCGRLRERDPAASVYNRMCDIEWNMPVGETPWCGGVAMMRAAALRDAGGFDETMPAGEEPELCLRLGRKGWKIQRIDQPMALHDADMTRFGQWWRRMKRSGTAFAQSAAMHGRDSERFYVREMRGVWLWGLALPVAIIVMACITRGWGAVAALLYPLQCIRVWRGLRRRGIADGAGAYAIFCVLGKFPQMLGQAVFLLGGKRRRSCREGSL